MSRPNPWSASDDIVVWDALGDLPRTSGGNLATNREVNAVVRRLASRFGRTDGAIKSRLKHLDDPGHAAHARLHGIAKAPPKRPALVSREPVAAYQQVPMPALLPAVPPPPAAVSAPPATATADGALNAGQKRALERVLAGESVFITGAAGTGKTFLLRRVIDALAARFGATENDGTVPVTAPTGIAASHLGGQTIHSWAGIGLGKGGVDKLLPKVLSNEAAVGRWRRAAALVIDEVSMLDGSLFTALEAIGRAARGVCAPFGGLQLVLCGDFFQLPPVSLAYAGFAFESAAWSSCRVTTHALTEIVRQQGDSAFISPLNELRIGVCSPATTAALAACHVGVKPRPSDGIVPTRLYCTNKDVDAENRTHLHALPGETMPFHATDVFKREPQTDDGARKLLDALDKKAARTLELKIGAQVMLTKNWADVSLVKGSRGVVVGFRQERVSEGGRMTFGVAPGEYTCPVVRFDDGATLAVRPASVFQALEGGACARTQLPLKLAWALTVHKRQGMTLSRCELLLEDAFAPGQAYVALSCVTSLAGLWLYGGAITQAVVKAHPAVVHFYRAFGGA